MIATVPMTAKIPLILEPQPEGGWTVTSPLLPELITEGDTIEEIRENVQDCFAGLVEMYEDMERPLPAGMLLVRFEDGACNTLDAGVGSFLRYREVARSLRRLGCVEDTGRRAKGSHRKWINPHTGQSTRVPDWGRKDLKIGTLRAANPTTRP